MLGRYDLAADTYRRLVELRPDSARAWSNLGIAEVQSGRIDEGRTSLQRALELARGANEADLAATTEAQLRELETPD